MENILYVIFEWVKALILIGDIVIDEIHKRKHGKYNKDYTKWTFMSYLFFDILSHIVILRMMP